MGVEKFLNEQILELRSQRAGLMDEIAALKADLAATEQRERWGIANCMKLEQENAKLREALELITRECQALNKGPVAVMIANRALGNIKE